ncbi:MAG: carboxypeptidase-like regulatory domain-containing protein [Methanoregula sp.]|nr:carboxypeptidase-like regulatory domain-containing protein [Methanoregula sp.]
MTLLSRIGKTGWILIIILFLSLTYTVSAVSGSNSVTVFVTDTRTRENLAGAQVYLDGGYRGVTGTVDGTGTLVMQDVTPGTYTVRVTRTGFKEATTTFAYPAETTVDIALSKSALVSLDPAGPTPGAINVIFYPSSTSYSCTDKVKVSTPVYMTNETRFRNDVMNVINSTFLRLDKFTSASDPLPADYRERFNFYYYYDPAAPADAFSGCAGTVPEKYWDEVPFSDVTVVLYPSYYGIYANASCQPTGCTQDLGPGHTLMKAPADRPVLFSHESGHALFSLVDTYCGDTYYYQNGPYPNVWASLASCEADARSGSRDPAQCRQIRKTTSLSSSCTRNYWQWDPVPDIMANGYSGTFGDAATRRIDYVLSQAGAGSS